MKPVAVYQPIVDLATGATVAYEALARGPQGQSPAAMFSAAQADGSLAELDWACRAAAARGALEAGLPAEVALFVNTEPAVAGTPPPAHLLPEIQRARNDLSIFLEITERAITDRPSELLEVVEALRADGVGIALDDVGADPRSLALLPVLRPDIIKLDMSLVRNAPTLESAAVMNAVCAHAEATGAIILAEGVEDEQHLLVAQTLGATLAQGWYFGRPGPLPGFVARSGAGAARGLEVTQRPLRRSPVEVVADRLPLRPGRKDVLIAVSKRLEAHALELGTGCVVVSAFQEARFFTPATHDRYEELAARTALVAALGIGLPDEPARGVRGAALEPGDPLAGEWNVAVLGSHFAAALVARDLGDSGPDRLRRFEFALTFERDTVIDVVHSLLARVTAKRVPESIGR
ncbi:MAG: diguanylate cyclase [Solirubrobacteraceae bacterium]|nr:diguanylate cyclase [Solirubrobacteraceae bacterium]